MITFCIQKPGIPDDFLTQTQFISKRLESTSNLQPKQDVQKDEGKLGVDETNIPTPDPLPTT